MNSLPSIRFGSIAIDLPNTVSDPAVAAAAKKAALEAGCMVEFSQNWTQDLYTKTAISPSGEAASVNGQAWQMRPRRPIFFKPKNASGEIRRLTDALFYQSLRELLPDWEFLKTLPKTLSSHDGVLAVRQDCPEERVQESFMFIPEFDPEEHDPCYFYPVDEDPSKLVKGDA